jgi:hypothetical protein
MRKMHGAGRLMGWVVAMAWASVASAAEPYVSDEGFTIMPPDGWVTVDAEVQRERPRDLAWMTGLMSTNFDQVAVVFGDPTRDPFTESLNVIVSGVEMPVGPEYTEEVRQGLERQLSGPDVTLESLDLAIEQLAGRDAFVATIQSTHSGQPLTQVSYMLPSDGRTFVLTGTSGPQDAGRYRAIFDRSVNSLEAPMPAGSGSGASSVPNRPIGDGDGSLLAPVLIAVGVGLVILGLVAYLVFSGGKAAKRKR